MSHVNRYCEDCFRLGNQPATPGRQAFAWGTVVLATIAMAAGVLSILASSGINVYGLNALGTLTIYGWASLTIVSFVFLVVGLAWIFTKSCCPRNRQEADENDEDNNRPPEQSNLEKLLTVLIGEIFSHLSLQELGRVCSVSKTMRMKLKNERNQRVWNKALLEKYAFGAQKWAMYFGNVEVEPALPKNIIEILSSPCPFFANQRVGDTHRLVLVPATVGGEALTLNKLRQLIQHPNNNGHATNYKYYSEAVSEKHGNTKSGRSCWLLMTKDMILKSKKQTYTAQQKLVTQQGKGNYTLPRALEAAVCILMEHVVSGNHLFGRNPLTYTRCSEKIEGECPVTVGGFGSDGLDVYYSSFDFECDGVGALRKFF